jgi:uncharacterized membrane protein
MTKNRLEAFSDGVIAIIITIMVLEMKVPHGTDLKALMPLLPVFFSYVLSFLFIGIYWNNHHHLLQAATSINGGTLLANMHLLFWLSLIPFVTGWMGENNFATVPVALYGVAKLMSGFAYFLLTKNLIKHHPKDSILTKAISNGKKEKISLVLYALSIPLAFLHAWVSVTIYFIVALMWLVPDKRIEKHLHKL